MRADATEDRLRIQIVHPAGLGDDPSFVAATAALADLNFAVEKYAGPAESSEDSTEWVVGLKANAGRADAVLFVHGLATVDVPARWQPAVHAFFTAERALRSKCVACSFKLDRGPKHFGSPVGDLATPIGRSIIASALRASHAARLSGPVEHHNVARTGLGDQPASEDFLGFEPYVDVMAEFLLASGTRPPLVVSIEGEWGSGKSSFMRQLRARIDARKGNLTAWFNPWRHDKDEALWASFAVELVRQIDQGHIVRRAWRRLVLAKRRFRPDAGYVDLVRALLVAAGFVFAFAVALGKLKIDAPLAHWTQGAGWLASVVLAAKAARDTHYFFARPFKLICRSTSRPPTTRGAFPSSSASTKTYAMCSARMRAVRTQRCSCSSTILIAATRRAVRS